jgi:replicative DNA helicase
MPQAKNTSGGRKSQDVVQDIGREMGRIPPQALDVEEAVLGAMLLEPLCVDEALEALTGKCFYLERNRLIFDAIVELRNSNAPVDIITVSEKLRQKDTLEKVGGPSVLAELSGKIGSAAYMESYVRILQQKAIQRDLISAAHIILSDAYNEQVKVDDLIDTAQSKVYEATQSSDRKNVQAIGSVINQALDRIQQLQSVEGLSGVPSGFATLDRITNGWQASDLIILAARPSVGKTAFSLNLARNAAVDHNIPVAFFSLEMSSLQLAMRLMTSESGLSADKIKGGIKLQNDEWNLLEQSLKKLSSAPLYVDETPGLPIMEFRSKVKNLVKQKKVRLVIVDYLQLMQGPIELKGVREQEVAAISRMLKATAKELNIPIIALSQLSRQAVQRQGGGGKPVLSDLRESGSIEQDADMVIFIHRPDFVGLSESEGDREKTQIIIAKHRNGETRDIDMLFKSERVKFVEVSDTLYADTPEYESGMNSRDYVEPEERW